MSLDVKLDFGSSTKKAWFQSLGTLGRLGKMDVGSLGGAFEVRLECVWSAFELRIGRLDVGCFVTVSLALYRIEGLVSGMLLEAWETWEAVEIRIED